MSRSRTAPRRTERTFCTRVWTVPGARPAATMLDPRLDVRAAQADPTGARRPGRSRTGLARLIASSVPGLAQTRRRRSRSRWRARTHCCRNTLLHGSVEAVPTGGTGVREGSGVCGFRHTWSGRRAPVGQPRIGAILRTAGGQGRRRLAEGRCPTARFVTSSTHRVSAGSDCAENPRELLHPQGASGSLFRSESRRTQRYRPWTMALQAHHAQHEDRDTGLPTLRAAIARGPSGAPLARQGRVRGVRRATSSHWRPVARRTNSSKARSNGGRPWQQLPL
jgi:hypothetical protein